MPTPGQIELAVKAAAAAAKKVADALKAKNALEELAKTKDLATKAAALKKLEDAKIAADAAKAAQKAADAKAAEMQKAADAAAAKKAADAKAAEMQKAADAAAAKKAADAKAAADKKAAADAKAAADKKIADKAAADKATADAKAAADKAAVEKKARDDAAAKTRADATAAAQKRKDDLAAAAKARADATAIAKKERDDAAAEALAKREADAKARADATAIAKKERDDASLAATKAREDATAIAKQERDDAAIARREAAAQKARDDAAAADAAAAAAAAGAAAAGDGGNTIIGDGTSGTDPGTGGTNPGTGGTNPGTGGTDPGTGGTNPGTGGTNPGTGGTNPGTGGTNPGTDGGDIPATDQPTTGTPQVGASAFADDGRTLAFDTFKNTLALFFGKEEIDNGGWAQGVYKSVSGFYKSGSSITEGLNLSLQDVRNNPDLKNFTKRFNGVYQLQDRLVAGEAIDVPTIAEYFKAESDMGNVLRDAGMGDLATQDFLGTVIGKGKSVLEISNLISGAFSAIDNAPQALKDTLQKYYPGADRASIAKAMLLGKEGAAELEKKIKGISVLSAAGSQGVAVDLTAASDIAARGYNYQDALTGFGTVKELERANTLASMEGDVFTQTQAQKYVFEQDVAQKQKLAAIKEKEIGRFSGSSGTSKGSLSSGYLNRQSSAGIF